MGDAGVDDRPRHGVRQAAAAARGERHELHVPGRSERTGADLFGHERKVAAVHVGVADQRAEGPEQAGASGCFGGDVVVARQSVRDAGQAFRGGTDERGPFSARRLRRDADTPPSSARPAAPGDAGAQRHAGEQHGPAGGFGHGRHAVRAARVEGE